MIQNADVAKLTIRLHAGHAIMKGRRSIVGALRPFTGIYESDFRDFYSSLICLHSPLSSDNLDRQLIYACWDFCSRLRNLVPTLVSNHLIDDRQQLKIITWVDCVDSYCRRCMHQLDIIECMSNFIEYLASDLCSSPEVYINLVPMLKDQRIRANPELLLLLDNAIRAIVTV